MKKASGTLVLFLIMFAAAQAQVDSRQLAKIDDALREKISKAVSGWAYRSIEPIEGSKNVIIQQWELGNIMVRISVAQWDTEANATQAFKDFKAQLKVEENAAANRGKELHLIKGDLPGVGDEASTLDIRGSEGVGFRKGKFLVFVSVPRPDVNNDTFFSRKFAGYVASVLDLQ